MLCNNIILCFLQQNINVVKVENYVDVLSEDKLTGMKADEFSISSTLSEVGLDFR
jgi:hypothetical protein